MVYPPNALFVWDYCGLNRKTAGKRCCFDTEIGKPGEQFPRTGRAAIPEFPTNFYTWNTLPSLAIETNNRIFLLFTVDEMA